MRSFCVRSNALCVFALVALLVTGSGCASLHSPRNGQQVCGANATVTFSGYVPFSNKSVQIQQAPSPTGPWTTVGSITSSSTVSYTIDDVDYYYFTKGYQLSKWTSVAEGGAQLHTFVRARLYVDQFVPTPTWRTLSTFDMTPPSGSTTLECLNIRVQAGDTGIQATEYCASDESPVVEVLAPPQTTCGGCTSTVVNGNVTINSPLSAAQYVCTQTINGSLIVTEAAPEVVPLPALETVTGNITADYSFPFVYQAANTYRRRFIDMPVLSSIGGDVSLDAKRWQGTKAVPNGLDAVTSVGGDITITLWDANPNVFAGLTSHTGNLTIQGFVSGQLDVYLGNSFENLTEVTGDVLVRRFFATNGALMALESVDGDLTVGELRFYPSQSFTSLESVSGDFEFNAMKQLGGPWTNAVTIGGELRYIGHTSIANFSAMPLAGAQVNALRIENNAVLNSLTGTTFQVGGGDIVISGNPALSQCQVDAFLAAQQAGGWTGSAVVSGTVGCP
jgi:hypothetical protein